MLGAAVAVGGDVDVFVVIADAADTLACKKKIVPSHLLSSLIFLLIYAPPSSLLRFSQPFVRYLPPPVHESADVQMGWWGRAKRKQFC